MREDLGFTLIELMVVVAITAVLAVLTLPVYQQYVAKSQLSSALADMRSGQVGFDSQVVVAGLSTFQLSDIGLPHETARCTFEVLAGEDGYIRCVLKGNPLVAGKYIEYVRSEGVWDCRADVDIERRLLPAGCG